MADDERLTVTGVALLGLPARPAAVDDLRAGEASAAVAAVVLAARRAQALRRAEEAGRVGLRLCVGAGHRAPQEHDVRDHAGGPAGVAPLARRSAVVGRPPSRSSSCVRVFFGDQGSADQLRTSIERTGRQARRSLAELGTIVAAASARRRRLARARRRQRDRPAPRRRPAPHDRRVGGLGRRRHRRLGQDDRRRLAGIRRGLRRRVVVRGHRRVTMAAAGGSEHDRAGT